MEFRAVGVVAGGGRLEFVHKKRATVTHGGVHLVLATFKPFTTAYPEI